MKIHEYQAREFFKNADLPVPEGKVADGFKSAQEVIKEIGYPAVLKSQVLVGGRGRAGGIRIVRNPEELARNFRELKELKIKGFPVEHILVSQAIDIKQEFYTAATVDYAKDDVVVIASPEGGVDIEETAKKNPSKIHKYYLEGKKDIDEKRWPAFIKNIFSTVSAQKKGTEILRALIGLFFQHDCTLAEINPLVIDAKDQWYAADAKMIFDDNALFRHPDIAALRDVALEDADEIEAKKHDLSFVKLDGNIGCVVNGAGLAMATTDTIKMLGGEPANFLDVGGSSNPEKVFHALKIILQNKKVKAVLVNIFGGITRCDDIAKGMLEARKSLSIKAPLVVRLTGTNEKEAVTLLSKENIKIYPSMREAVRKVVELTK